MRRVYSVAIGNLLPVVSDNAVKMIKKLEGFVALTPQYPHGTLLYFGTLADARRGRNILAGKGIVCGVNICTFDLSDDMQQAVFVGNEYGGEIDEEG